eukprot:g6483.t1
MTRPSAIHSMDMGFAPTSLPGLSSETTPGSLGHIAECDELEATATAQTATAQTATTTPEGKMVKVFTDRMSRTETGKDEEGPQMSWKKLVIDDAQHEQRAIALSEQRRELAQKAPEVEEDKGDEAHRGTLAMMERFVESSRFEAVVAAVLISNSIFMGVQLQLAADSYGVASQTDIESDTAFVAVNTVYALLFTVELVFRIIAHRMSFFCTSDRASLFWNYLDISLVISSLLEVILVIAISVDGVDLGMSNRLRALRIIRLARLIRMMRAMRFFRGLRTLVYSIFYTLKALIWSLILLLMMMYLVGILLTDAVLAHVARFPTPDEIPVDSDEAVLYESFGSLHLAMHSLFRSITGGVDWAVYARAFAQVNWMWTYLFTSFIAFSVFAVLNVMTGVFCQRATELAERDKEAQLMAMQIETEHIMDEARRLFRSFDVVRQGSLTLMEVELMLQDEDVKAALAALDLVVYDPWRFFRLLDLNGNGAVTEEEFVEGCLRLRGPARTFDVASLAEENIRMKAKLASLEQQEVLSQQMISHFRVEMLQVGKLARQTSDYLNRCKASEKSVGYATSTEEEGPSMQDEGKQASKGHVARLFRALRAETRGWQLLVPMRSGSSPDFFEPAGITMLQQFLQAVLDDHNRDIAPFAPMSNVFHMMGVSHGSAALLSLASKVRVTCLAYTVLARAGNTEQARPAFRARPAFSHFCWRIGCNSSSSARSPVVWPYMWRRHVHVRYPARPWEMLRYQLAAEILQEGQLTWPGLIWFGLDDDWTTAIFKKVPLEATSECFPGHQFLRMASAAYNFGIPSAEEQEKMRADLVKVETTVLQTSLCGGWPIFGLLALLTPNSSGQKRGVAPFDGSPDREGFPLEVLTGPEFPEILKNLKNCTATSCVQLPRLLEVQHIQSMALLGLGTCPPGSVMAWMDKLEPVPSIPLCVRTQQDVVAGWPDCLVLDVGANLGSCSMVLVRSGYQVMAFEPLPSTAALLRASLRFNDGSWA